MLNILIVDDEKYIRKGLAVTIKEAGPQFVICGEAENGQEALALIEDQVPDVVITDIKMPKMDGIALVGKLSLDYPKIRKIILSGFDEFDYVREAMKNGAADYLLKPVDEERIKTLLSALDEEIHEEKKRHIRETELQKRIFLKDIISGKAPMLGEGEKNKLFNGCEEGRYFAIVISIDNYNYYMRQEPDKTQEKMEAVNEGIQSLLCEKKIISDFTYNNDIIVICKSKNGDNTPLNLAQEIHSNIPKKDNLIFSLSIGVGTGKINEIDISYKSAIKHLEHRFYKADSNIFGILDSDNHFTSIEPPEMYENISEKIKDSFYAGKTEQVLNNLSILCDDFFKKRIYPNEAYKILTKIYLKIEGESSGFYKMCSQIYGHGFSYIEKLKEFDCLKLAIDFSKKLYCEIMDRIMICKSKKSKEIVEVAKNYILHNYAEDLSLEKVAEIVYINPNYLSEIFKCKTGENFVEYITRIRVQKAKKLLRDFEYKTYQVGQMVGYEDPSYFSKVFKKVVGISPSKYRNIIMD